MLRTKCSDVCPGILTKRVICCTLFQIYTTHSGNLTKAGIVYKPWFRVEIEVSSIDWLVSNIYTLARRDIFSSYRCTLLYHEQFSNVLELLMLFTRLLYVWEAPPRISYMALASAMVITHGKDWTAIWHSKEDISNILQIVDYFLILVEDRADVWITSYFWSKVMIWNVNCARTTAFIFDTWTDILVKVSKFLR